MVEFENANIPNSVYQKHAIDIFDENLFHSGKFFKLLSVKLEFISYGIFEKYKLYAYYMQSL